jgi:hypothetical protein
MIMAFLRLGHGVQISTAVTGFVFTLAAILYVDDTDVLHWAKSPTMSDEEFFDQVQQATNDWANLAIATGGALKPKKCFWYLIAFRFCNGRAFYKKLSQLPRRHLTVPLPDGTSAPIPLRDTATSEETLGVFQCPEGLPQRQLQKMSEAGIDFADKAATHPLPRTVSRMAHDYMLIARMRYGIECVLATPSELSTEMRKILYRCLPCLGINRNYKTEFCTLPRMYQGLELVDWPIEKLAADIFVMLRFWDGDNILSHLLRDAYELLQMETGLDGNIFLRPFSQLSGLATHSWMKILWQYLSHHDVTLELLSSTHIAPVREGDAVFMELLIADGWHTGKLCSANRVRKLKHVHHVSALVASDGVSVLPEMYTTAAGTSSMTWSLERPSERDFLVWQEALALIAPNRRLRRPLGHFLRMPPGDSSWTATADGTQLCHRLTPSSFELFQQVTPIRFTRAGTLFHQIATVSYDPGFPFLATVSQPTDTHARLHSSAPAPSPAPVDLDLISVLRSWENQSLWRHLKFDGDGSWLLNAIIANTLIICHDGSYMKKVTSNVCAAALVMHCTVTGFELSCTWVECCDEADNYRAELLGGLCSSLLLKAISSVAAVYGPKPLIRLCDNMGVVKHGNTPHLPLKDKQSHSDVVRLFKQLERELPFPRVYEWVEGHADDDKGRKLTLKERLNTRCDALAKEALMDALYSRSFISSDFPFETVRVKLGPRKVTKSLRPSILHHSSRRIAKQVFGFGPRGSKIINEEQFELIYWDIFPRVLKKFPSSFRDWLSKTVTGCCGINHFLSYWKPGVRDVCPSCKYPGETIMHITRCPEVGRTTIFYEMVTDLEQWMADNYTPSTITEMVSTYLRNRGTESMSSRLTPHSHFFALASAFDFLGWRCLLEGRIPTLLVQEMHNHLANTPSRIGALDWAAGFVERLLRITHRQWQYRNSVVHYKVDGLTQDEHEAVISRFEELLQIDPSQLLSKHRHLFESQNFEDLGTASAVTKQYWIYSVESALAAAAHHRHSRRRRHDALSDTCEVQSLRDSPAPILHSAPAPHLPCELGIRYKKRRMK